MFELLDGRASAFQWDTGLYIDCTGLKETDQVHFCRPGQVLAIHPAMQGEKLAAPVPDELLQQAQPIIVFAYVQTATGEITRVATRLCVTARPKPPGYIASPTEALRWADLQEQIDKLSEEIENLSSAGSGGNGADYSFLTGLKYYALGDSIVSLQGTKNGQITFGDCGYSTDLQGRDITNITVDGYVSAIENRYGLAATNYGKGGHTLVGDYATLAALDYSDVALVTIAYGVNDARTGVPLGTVNSTDTTTFAGAMNQLLRKIYTDNPECRVLVLSPMQRLTVTDFGIATPNANGNYLIDFVNMCKAIAEKRSTAFLDQYRCTGINQTNLYYYTVEGVHPVNQGFARIRNAVIGILDELFALEYEPIGVMTNTGDTEPEEPDTGGDTGGEEPPEGDNATVVDISDQFTRYGIDMDGWGTGIKTSASQSPYVSARYHPESNVTYTIVTYGEASLSTASDKRMWSYSALNDDGTVKSGSYRYSASGGRGEADVYESVTIDGVEYTKMTAIWVSGDEADNVYWNIPCLATLVDRVEVSYI